MPLLANLWNFYLSFTRYVLEISLCPNILIIDIFNECLSYCNLQFTALLTSTKIG